MKEALRHKYLDTVKEKINNFDSIEKMHIPIEQNTKVDVLSKLVSTRATGINHSFMQETLERPNYVMNLEVTVAIAEHDPWT